MIDYDIPYLQSYNYLMANLDEYLADPEHFLDKIIKELKITGPKDEGLAQSIFKFLYRNNDDNIKFNDVKEALANMLNDLSAFLVDQKEYKIVIEKRIQEIAEKYKINPELLIAEDNFPKNSIRVAKGNIKLSDDISIYYANDASVEQSINILTEYFEHLDFNDFIQKD